MVKNIMNAIVAIIAFAAMLHSSEAEDLIVGDELGWTVPTDGSNLYGDWVANNGPFVVNVDTLVFVFTMGQQDVASVNQVDYENCFVTNPLWVSTAPQKVLFSQPGTFYFVGTFNGHCVAGQKLAVTFVNDSEDIPQTSNSP